MTFRGSPLLLAGLLAAISCSDADNPAGSEPPAVPASTSTPGNVLQAFTCNVDVRANTVVCQPLGTSAGGASAAINIGGGGFVQLTSSNSVLTPTSHTFDVTITNNMVRQIVGTTDGVTAHAYGMRVFHYNASSPSAVQPTVTQKTNPALPASVTMNGDGTQVFTGAGSQVRPYFQYVPQILLPGQTSTAKTWSFTLDNVDSYTMSLYVSAEVRWPSGWLEIVPDTPVVQVGTGDTLTAQVRNAFGARLLEGVNWTSGNTGIVTVTELSADSLAEITGVAEGVAWVKATSAVNGTNRRDSVLVTVDNAPVPQLDSIDAPARGLVRVSSARLHQGMAAGDSVVPSQVITTAGGTATVGADRGFTYVSRGSFTGTDTVRMDVTDGLWTVQKTLLVKVAPTHYWFARPGGTGDGSNAYPLGTLQAAVDSAGAGDTILVLRNGSTDLAGAATLKSNQAVIGHGVLADSVFLRVTGLNEPGRVDTLFQGQGLGTPLANTGAAVITLASDAASTNVIRGVNITATSAAPISGTGFGALTLSRVTAQATGGPALSLQNGAVAAVFTGLHSSGSSSSGISLTSVNGSILAIASSITTPSGTAFSVSGGDVDVSLPGDIGQASNNPLLSVTGHTGDLVLGGTLTASNGTGLQFSNADGTYTLGTLSFSGGDAAVDVISGSAGTFSFGAGSSITNPSGNVFRIEGSAPSFAYPGSFSKSSAGVGVLIQNNTGGSITFSGASKVLSTGSSHAVSIATDAAAVSFSGGGLQISTSGGRGVSVQDGGTLTVTGAGNTLATTGAAALYIANAGAGASGISFQSISASGAANAVVINTLAGGGVQVTGTGTAGSGGTLSATGTAVVISGADTTRLRRVVVSAPVAINASSFGGLRVDSSSVTATAGTALGLTTGRLYVSDVAVSSTAGAALSTTGVALSGGLNNLSATTATGNAVALNNTTTGTLTVAAGTITMNVGAGAAIVAIGAANTAAFTYSGSVTQNANAALLDVNSGHAGSLTFNTGTLTAANGSGLQFDNADGSYSFSGTTNLSNSTGGADAGIDVTNGSGGTFTFASTSTITNPAGEAIRISSSGPAFTYGGAISKTNGSTGITVTGSTGTIAFNSLSGTVRTITSGTTNPAVNLTGNTGATISFGGGNLAISSDDGNAFNATGGGTVNVTGTPNTLSSTGGIALNVNATTVGASGLTWRSISANGGANGIALNNIGSGGVQVVGNGGVCTLATPTCSGGTIQNTTGDGVRLTTVSRVRLDLVRVLDTGGHGIGGFGASGLTLANSLVQGAGDADDEAGIFFATVNASNLAGTDSIIGSVVHAPADLGVLIHNYRGALTLVVQNSTFSGTDQSTAGVVTGDDLFRLVADRLATITAKFTGNTFDQSESDGLTAIAQSSLGSGGGTLNVTVDGNTFTGDNGGASCASGCNDGGIVAWGKNAATVRFTIQNNDVQNQRTEAIAVRAENTASVQGTIQGNTIGGAASRSGSYTSQGILLNSDDSADLVARVHDNTVGSTFGQGIWANAADAGAGSPRMDVTLTDNSTGTPEDDSGPYLPSIDVQGTTGGVTMCARVEDNTAQPGQASAGSIDMLQAGGAAFGIEGLPSSTSDASSYVAGNNPASSSPVYALAFDTFTPVTCRTPAATPAP